MDSRLDEIKDMLRNLQIDMAVVRTDLNHHIRRTDLAEQRVDLLQRQFAHIDRHIAWVEGGAKLLGGLVAVVGVMAGMHTAARALNLFGP